MVVALIVAVMTAAAATAVAAGRRQRGSRQPAPAAPPSRPRTPEDEEREALLAEIGDTIVQRLDDAGLWLPDGTSVETLYVPVDTVGGDFLGTAEIDGEAVAFIGDVAGHGIDAALVALRLKEAFDAAVVEGAALDEAVTAVNDLLRAEEPGLATLFACRLDGEGRLTFVNAGHVPPLVVDGVPPDELGSTGPLIGAFAHDYEAATIDVEPSSRLIAFTDGLTEAFGARGGLTGDEIRAVVDEPGRLADLHRVLVAKQPEPVRDDIAAFELTVGGTEEDSHA